ncbi:MAG: hypothetical protein J5J06_18500 [Phycisphaerae bacterium]|nr:hypothetical protein [Phycisphaerae bacterium]
MPKLLFSIALILSGAAFAWRYLSPWSGGWTGRAPIGGDRPWRRLGAGIMLVISVMFVVGIYVVDIPDRPRPYAAYWAVMLGMVLWLCVLAVRDVLYTRRVLDDYRAGRTDLKGVPLTSGEGDD